MEVTPAIDGAVCLVASGVFALMVVRWYNGIRPTPPLRLLSRATDYLRAGSLLVREMARGAWARRTRWQECLQRARLER
jgi:hypothetical protein